MAIDQHPQRKRRLRPKVKTGCGTCKIRRIKCDEAKPTCQRCSSTGRKCDGYKSDILISREALQNSTNLIQRMSVHIPGNADEKRGFDFFLRNTALELSGYYGSSFWERLVLAASIEHPSLQHAVIAIGALHEDFSHRTQLLSTQRAASGEDHKNQFAMNQYAKAMTALRRSLSRKKEDSLTALMSCILFVCFDSLRGWFESAMVHLQSGLRILRDMRRSPTADHMIEENIVPLFRRLSMQCVIYVETKAIDDKTTFARSLIEVTGQEIIIPKEFGSLEEARNALDQSVDGLFKTFYMWDGNLPMALQSTEALSMFEKYRFQLFLWNLAFQKFMASRSKSLSNKEVQGAALLKIHHTTAKVMAGIQPDMNDMRALDDTVNRGKFWQHVDDFQIIIDLSRPLIATAEQDTKNGKPSRTFSSDFGLVGPLYYVCVCCPLENIRNAAMELMLRCPRQEGMWNSTMIAQMIQQFWDLEASYYKEAQGKVVGVDEFGHLVVPKDFCDHGSVHFAFFGHAS